MSICPYCNSAKSLLLGHVYCSRQSTPMQELETGTLFIKTKKLEETADHESRLSIRLMLNGRQYYRVGNHDHIVTPDNYLVVNQGQYYRTSFHGTTEQEMILVAFQPGFAEGLLHALVTPQDKLLDDPFQSNAQPVQFFEKTYNADPAIGKLFSLLRSLMNKDISLRKEADLDGIYTALLTRLLDVHRITSEEISRLGSVKSSTRAELYRRLSIARDYMDAHLHRRVSVEEAANAACLSPHHFKRIFKQLFGATPHRYHVYRRLESARQLLRHGCLSVGEICHLVGFEDDSSFIRLFRRRFGYTPGCGPPISR
ncbi:MAG: AraC family transcriptional regulator [Haliscomenobacteraceae bacterium CHB4]|nr:HTH-type transcriptional activator RhaS [Saprospiraceae bacterium]MCE7922403.1 AraC family transcriptional regulator [Haliscomenobacteraceae bacterium CHB4]